jgi:beta-carotene ketolase (CrtW type)
MACHAAKPPSWALRPDYKYLGLVVAACAVASWGVVLLYSLLHGLGGGVLRAVFLVALMAWLYTALFIVAHDAMHALVAPRHRRLNHAVGALAAALYAQFEYEPLRAAHAEHHREPASAQARPDERMPSLLMTDAL